MKLILSLVLLFSYHFIKAQTVLSGSVLLDDNPVETMLYVTEMNQEFETNTDGTFEIYFETEEKYHFQIAHPAGFNQYFELDLLEGTQHFDFILTTEPPADLLDEIVISGTLKPVLRSESLVPVEVYTPSFFKKNPTSNIFEGLQTVNGVKPQVNCSVWNTGDIHINGLEGPYTFVLIDGMPIVSGLSTVYGLSGIPNSLIERVEVVKGPASSLYGSEAVGGLINIITKSPKNAPLFSADMFGTSWGEINTDVGVSTKVGEKAHLLLGVNYFNYSNPFDKNNDNFTDLTLQDRISVFQKWNFTRKSNKLFSIAGRYFYEDRWGGEMNWNKNYRGGDEVYGESIYTSRYELMGTYELPVAEKMFFSFSYADHDQNSVYGNTPYMAKQKVGFGQLTWDKKLGNHDMLFGAAFRYTNYDDN